MVCLGAAATVRAICFGFVLGPDIDRTSVLGSLEAPTRTETGKAKCSKRGDRDILSSVQDRFSLTNEMLGTWRLRCLGVDARSVLMSSVLADELGANW
ncbi:hypothetical protein RIF29_10708 [Crotalaria pallida]|uniref:Uncharacterized protein n=1 Tax=Crotalaria pallida TaxID=3830 RepID=A0AAN9FT46_CROPI